MAKHNIGAVLSLKDNMSATLKGIRREQSEFKKDVEDTRKRLERTYKRKYNLKLEHTAAMKKIKETRKNLEPLRQKVVTVLATKDMITRNVRKTHNQLKTFARKTFAPVVAIKDKTAGFFKNITNRFFNLKTLAITALGGIGIGKIFESGAELEKQSISMEHFIGINNKDLDKSGVQKLADDFMKQLRHNAKVTPFSDSEVIAAGTRALGVTGGDTKEAMELVKVAEDMAALTPGKTVMDAMEALADARTGEMERLKEFNAKVSAEEFKTLGFQGVVEKKLKSQFEGGAKKLSKSASGLWATITGGVGAKLQDLGLSVIEKLRPHLESFVAWMDKSGPTIDKWADKISSGIGIVIDYFGQFTGWVRQNMPAVREIIGNAAAWISDRFGWVGEKMTGLQGVASTVWPGIQGVIQTAWEVIGPALDLVASGARIVANAFELAWPTIKTIVSSVWDVVEPILGKLGDALGWVADKAGKIADWLGKKVEARSGTGEAKGVHGRHATGLSYVPFDGYIAELHRGEAVLPANMNPFTQNTRSVTNNTTTNKTENKSNIIINVNGINKSTNEIINEFVPQLKLVLANM